MKESYRDLTIWSESIKLAVEVYRLTASFPADEKSGLISQMRRTVVSIASNIAEGQGRSTRGERRIFLGYARGALCELETQLEISRQVGLTRSNENEVDHLFWVCAGIRRGLGALIR